VPRTRPVPLPELFEETVDPEVLAEHVEAVRAGSDGAASQ